MIEVKWPQEGPKMAPRGPKMAQGCTPKAMKNVRAINMFASPRHLDSKMAPRWLEDDARGPKMDPGRPKMAQDGPKRSHIHEICDSYTLLQPSEALLVRRSARNLVFYYTKRGGVF